MHHKSKDTHHGGTAVVQFNTSLSKLGLGAEFIPSKVNEAVAEISREFSGSSHILHDEKLKKTDEENDLSESGLRNGIRAGDGGKTIRVRVEGISLKIDASRKVKSGTGHDLSKEGKHGNTSMLKFDVSKTVELGFIAIGNQTKRIVESERLLGAQFSFERLDAGGGRGLLGRGKSSGGANEGCEDSELHGDRYYCFGNCTAARLVFIIVEDQIQHQSNRRGFLSLTPLSP